MAIGRAKAPSGMPGGMAEVRDQSEGEAKAKETIGKKWAKTARPLSEGSLAAPEREGGGISGGSPWIFFATDFHLASASIS